MIALFFSFNLVHVELEGATFDVIPVLLAFFTPVVPP